MFGRGEIGTGEALEQYGHVLWKPGIVADVAREQKVEAVIQLEGLVHERDIHCDRCKCKREVRRQMGKLTDSQDRSHFEAVHQMRQPAPEVRESALWQAASQSLTRQRSPRARENVRVGVGFRPASSMTTPIATPMPTPTTGSIQGKLPQGRFYSRICTLYWF